MRRRHVCLLVPRRFKLHLIKITLHTGQNDCVRVQGTATRGSGLGGLGVRD